MTLMADCGEEIRPFADGPAVRAIKSDIVRGEFYKHHLATDADDKQEARRKAFVRAVKAAQDKGLIAIRDVNGTQFIWLVTKTNT
jgi:hypothetical protein